jgi:hypothetical protein
MLAEGLVEDCKHCKGGIGRSYKHKDCCLGCFISQQTGGQITSYYQLQKFNSSLVRTEEAGMKIDVESGLPQARPYLICMKAEALRVVVKHYTPTTITEAAATEVVESGKVMKEILKEMHLEGFF